MSSAVQKTTKSYTYRSSGGANADVSIEYSADLSALSRLEVGHEYICNHVYTKTVAANQQRLHKMHITSVAFIYTN
jgi:hypothetical protein